MIAAKKRIPTSPLKIAVNRNNMPAAKAAMLYPVKQEEKKILPATDQPLSELDISFDQWIMPAQPQGYIKGRTNDFL